MSKTFANVGISYNTTDNSYDLRIDGTDEGVVKALGEEARRKIHDLYELEGPNSPHCGSSNYVGMTLFGTKHGRTVALINFPGKALTANHTYMLRILREITQEATNY